MQKMAGQRREAMNRTLGPVVTQLIYFRNRLNGVALGLDTNDEPPLDGPPVHNGVTDAIESCAGFDLSNRDLAAYLELLDPSNEIRSEMTAFGKRTVITGISS